MSLYARKNFGYLQQAEAFFLSYSQIGLMLGSKDTEVLRQWRNQGIPIEVVCAGIKKAFEQFQEPPRHIAHCRYLVDRELKAWQARQAGSHDESSAGSGRAPLPGRDLPDPTDPERRRRKAMMRQGPPPQPAPGPKLPEGEHHLELWYRSMDRLTELGKMAETTAGREAYRWAWRQMQSLRQEALELKDDPHALGRLGLVIGEIEADMYERFYEGLSAADKASIDARLPAGVGEMLKNMSRAARDRQLQVWRRRLIEEVARLRPFFTP